MGRGGHAVFFEMCFGRFLSLLRCVDMVSAGQVRVMCCCLVLARFVVLGGFLMMSRRMFVMFCCLVMMLRCSLCHKFPPTGCRESNQVKSGTTAGLSHSIVIRLLPLG